ncbi:RNA-guided endonuclease InsQ/TnpB family protein [Nonomuraea angiospora]|uniref:RNA-guided endonuclease InsQ/TnpB family protein n=1 Tax=Nonomuraea angiospora TaxID=46172 RepID=UPI003F577234
MAPPAFLAEVARGDARIADRCRDFPHPLSTRLIRDNQVIDVEDLSIRNMVENRRLARAVSDASRRELRSMLEHKAAWYGRTLVAVDRWFPSSKLFHGRDVNAARNVLAAGPAES